MSFDRQINNNDIITLTLTKVNKVTVTNKVLPSYFRKNTVNSSVAMKSKKPLTV